MRINGRIVWLDYAKAILIYLMVVCHCGTTESVATIVYAFHMPAFFIVSGYLYRPHKWFSSLKSFLVPLAFYSVISFIIYAIPKLLRGQFDPSFLFERTIMPFVCIKIPYLPSNYEVISLFVGSWFIITLLCCRLLSGDIPIFNIVRKYSLWVITFFIIYLTLEQIVPINSSLVDSKFYRIIPSLPFFLIGGIIRNNLDITKLKWPIVILMAVSFVFISIFQGRCDILYLKYGVCYPLFFFNAIIGTLVFFKVLSILPRNRHVEIVSSGTFLILGSHIFLRNWLGALFNRINLVIPHSYYALVIGLIIVALCYYPIRYLLNRCPILLGKQ